MLDSSWTDIKFSVVDVVEKLATGEICAKTALKRIQSLVTLNI